jgi:anaerobic selenocysteine-containing dehydrogenase
VGLGERFWADERQALDFILEPAGLTFEEFKQRRFLRAPTDYRKHEKDGFRTASGKVEIYSERLKAMGYSPLPTYNPPQVDADYPLVLTNAKEARFCHSAHRNIPRLRRLSRQPVVQMNSQAAARQGLGEGDWVYIETEQGRIRQRLCLNADLDPRVVVAAYGWWFPEAGASKLYGWREANVNVLTDSMPPYDPAVGSTNLRGIPCRLSKV